MMKMIHYFKVGMGEYTPVEETKVSRPKRYWKDLIRDGKIHTKEDMSEEEILDINDHIEDFLYGTKISRFMSVLDIKKIKKIGFVNSDLSYIYDEFLQACYLVLDDNMPGQKKARKLGIFLLEEFERSGHWLNTGSYYTLLKELLKKEGR